MKIALYLFARYCCSCVSRPVPPATSVAEDNMAAGAGLFRKKVLPILFRRRDDPPCRTESERCGGRPFLFLCTMRSLQVGNQGPRRASGEPVTNQGHFQRAGRKPCLRPRRRAGVRCRARAPC